MKIATWNCNGAFRKKYQAVSSLNADVYIIQECEHPASAMEKEEQFREFGQHYLWKGENRHKGIGVFSRSLNLTEIKINEIYRGRRLTHFLPFHLDCGQQFLGVWTHQNDASAFAYIGQFYLLLENNPGFFRDLIIAGDFNSNSIWDSWDRWWNHSDCVARLHESGMESVYHHLTGEVQGKESIKTLFHRKNEETAYHIDYIFAPQEQIAKTKTFETGTFADYAGVSDHIPLVWEYEN